MQKIRSPGVEWAWAGHLNNRSVILICGFSFHSFYSQSLFSISVKFFFNNNGNSLRRIRTQDINMKHLYIEHWTLIIDQVFLPDSNWHIQCVLRAILMNWLEIVYLYFDYRYHIQLYLDLYKMNDWFQYFCFHLFLFRFLFLLFFYWLVFFLQPHLIHCVSFANFFIAIDTTPD